jgi:hypothetical protein
MSRNSSGTYSLPSGNPVSTGAVISSSWANNTMTDIATALTDSLSRTGQGGMSASLKLFDGTSGAPGWAWSSESTTGFYRQGSNDYRYAIGGIDTFTYSTSMFRMISATPLFVWQESDAAASNQIWGAEAASEQFKFWLGIDLVTKTNWLTVDRTNGTVDQINFANGTLQYGGIEVGYRGFRQSRTISGSDNTAASDNGGILTVTASLITLSLDSDIPALGLVTIINSSGGNITISATSVLSWYNGSAPASGSRTMAPGGVATAYSQGGGVYLIWGTGLT